MYNRKKLLIIFRIKWEMYPIFILLVRQFQNRAHFLTKAAGPGSWVPICCPVHRWSEGDLLCLAERRFLGRLHWSLLWPGSKTRHTQSSSESLGRLCPTFLFSAQMLSDCWYKCAEKWWNGINDDSGSSSVLWAVHQQHSVRDGRQVPSPGLSHRGPGLLQSDPAFFVGHARLCRNNIHQRATWQPHHGETAGQVDEMANTAAPLKPSQEGPRPKQSDSKWREIFCWLLQTVPLRTRTLIRTVPHGLDVCFYSATVQRVFLPFWIIASTVSWYSH